MFWFALVKNSTDLLYVSAHYTEVTSQKIKR